MATVAQYLKALDYWRDKLANFLTQKGIPSRENEKLNDLVPKVLELASGTGTIMTFPTADMVVGNVVTMQEVE